MNRTFIMLLALVAFLGAGFGGSFVGGVIYGQSLAANAGEELAPRMGAMGQAAARQGEPRGPGQRQPGQARQAQGAAGAGTGQAAAIESEPERDTAMSEPQARSQGSSQAAGESGRSRQDRGAGEGAEPTGVASVQLRGLKPARTPETPPARQRLRPTWQRLRPTKAAGAWLAP